MYQKILVALDGSEASRKALRAALALARAHGAGLHAVGVEEHLPHYAATVGERVGPFKVEFPLTIDVLESRAPEYLKARAGGKDSKVDGLVKVELDLHLAEAAGGGTEMRLSTDVAVLGKLGTLGHSIVIRKGDEVVGKFAEALRAQLER